MALYKVNADKGFKILLATTPGVVFINGPRFSERDAFVERFKSEDVNLLHLDSIYKRLTAKSIQTLEEIREYFACEPAIEKTVLDDLLITELHAYLSRCKSCIISGDLGNADLIQKIFDGSFTYVYVYPNSADQYKEAVVSYVNQCEKDPDATDTLSKLVTRQGKKSFDKNLDSYVDGLLKQRKQIFKSHREILGRALVILDK
jgi:hypothetical protein